MKRKMKMSVFMLMLLIVSQVVIAQENITVVTPSTEVAEGLDLYAVAEIFKDSENLEEFEQALNDPELGINNLDLDRDGYVDYIRVVEQVNDYTHIIILQVPLGSDEFQDVATIEIEKTGNNNYNMQVRGNEVIYGVDYYVAPVYVRIHRWPIITWIYRPYYRPYWSVFYFGYYPQWWKPYRPVRAHIYHTRTSRYYRRTTFHATRVNRVTTVHKVLYKPRTSSRVEKHIRNNQPNPVHERNMRATAPQPERKNATMKREVDEAYKNRSNRTSKREVRPSTNPVVRKNTSTRDDARKATRPVVRKNTPVKSDVRKATRPVVRKNTPVKSDARKATRPVVRKNTPVKSDARKAIRPNVRKNTSVRNDARKVTKPKVKRSAPIRSDAKKITKPNVKRSTPSKSKVKKPSKPTVKKSTTAKSSVRRTSKPQVQKKSTVKRNDKKTVVKKKSN